MPTARIVAGGQGVGVLRTAWTDVGGVGVVRRSCLQKRVAISQICLTATWNKSLRERHPWLRGSGVECRLEEAKRKGSVRGVSRMRCEGRMSSKRKAKRNNAYNAR